MKLNTSKITVPGLWDAIQAHEGKQFLTKKGLPFTYTIKGGQLFTDRPLSYTHQTLPTILLL